MKSTFGAAIRALGKYLIPLAGVIGGYFAGSAIGGASGLSAIVGKVPNMSSQNAWRISYAVAAVIYGGIGAIFWHLRGQGMWMELLGGAVGGFFFGVALWNGIGIFAGAGSSPGMLESLAGGLENVAKGTG